MARCQPYRIPDPRRRRERVSTDTPGRQNRSDASARPIPASARTRSPRWRCARPVLRRHACSAPPSLLHVPATTTRTTPHTASKTALDVIAAARVPLADRLPLNADLQMPPPSTGTTGTGRNGRPRAWRHTVSDSDPCQCWGTTARRPVLSLPPRNGASAATIREAAPPAPGGLIIEAIGGLSLVAVAARIGVLQQQARPDAPAQHPPGLLLCHVPDRQHVVAGRQAELAGGDVHDCQQMRVAGQHRSAEVGRNSWPPPCVGTVVTDGRPPRRMPPYVLDPLHEVRAVDRRVVEAAVRAVPVGEQPAPALGHVRARATRLGEVGESALPADDAGRAGDWVWEGVY